VIDSFPHLFAPGRIGPLELRNRVVLSPMDDNMADRDGAVTDNKIAWYRRFAQGGAGLVLTGNAYVTTRGRSLSDFQMGIDDDDKLPGLERLAAAVHEDGACVGVQIAHAGRQTTRRHTGGYAPEAPSPLPEPLFREMPEELTLSRIDAITALFAAAAVRAQQAGFDLLEVHGGHGQLQHLFLSPLTNIRVDEYGGTLENRARFALETVRAIRRAVGETFPIGYRISAEDIEKGGLQVSDMLLVAEWLEEAGVDYLHVSVGLGGSYRSARMILAPPGVGPAHLEQHARQVRERVSVPVITVGRYNSPAVAERALAAGSADFVAMGRALIADPDLPTKAAAGLADEIRPCVACEQGCIDRWLASLDVACAVNPDAGRGLRPALPSGQRSRLVVVGGGPAGLEAARVAAESGHEVVVFETEQDAGGQLALAATAPYQGEWADFLHWQAQTVQRLGVELRFGVTATAELIAAERPALVVVATGSRMLAAEHLDGWDLPWVTNVTALLSGRFTPGERVVIAGSDLIACRTALFLTARGRAVTLIADSTRPGDPVASDMAGPVVRPMIEEWIDEQVTVVHGVAPKRVVDGGLVVDVAGAVAPHLAETRISPDGEELIGADTVVLSTLRRPERTLYDALVERRLVPKVVLAGDAVVPRTVMHATSEGARAARFLRAAHEPVGSADWVGSLRHDVV
jgi:2,4-dienoyl-CoA reductase-like NADH-dependent reductase (Old Yellow Enzyme family)